MDRCWTAERLARHGLQHHPRCPLCDQAMENIRHLLLECPVARQAWHETLAWLRMTSPRARGLDRSLVATGQDQHSQANAQRARLHLAPHSLDDLEAQKQGHFRWSSALRAVPH
uniref:Uncharacterized protein n=1 Tax=Avena sativa TaxID=4498 RepID=A0ACD6AS56_AVESA